MPYHFIIMAVISLVSLVSGGFLGRTGAEYITIIIPVTLASMAYLLANELRNFVITREEVKIRGDAFVFLACALGLGFLSLVLGFLFPLPWWWLLGLPPLACCAAIFLVAPPLLKVLPRPFLKRVADALRVFN